MTNIELIIENTRLKYSSVILEESEIPTKESLRLQRMINESTSSIKKILKGGLLEEAQELYIDMAKGILEEALNENVRNTFKKYLVPGAAVAGAVGAGLYGDAATSDAVQDTEEEKAEAQKELEETLKPNENGLNVEAADKARENLLMADSGHEFAKDVNTAGTTMGATVGAGAGIGAGLLAKRMMQKGKM